MNVNGDVRQCDGVVLGVTRESLGNTLEADDRKTLVPRRSFRLRSLPPPQPHYVPPVSPPTCEHCAPGWMANAAARAPVARSTRANVTLLRRRRPPRGLA